MCACVCIVCQCYANEYTHSFSLSLSRLPSLSLSFALGVYVCSIFVMYIAYIYFLLYTTQTHHTFFSLSVNIHKVRKNALSHTFIQKELKRNGKLHALSYSLFSSFTLPTVINRIFFSLFFFHFVNFIMYIHSLAHTHTHHSIMYTI